ncbi:MAG: amidohydrolase family protein [Bacteroidales bacterium]|nr:amidohydrolase family protein [Bacteroidales bacterium]
MRTSLSLSAAILLIMLSCNAQKKHADLILTNGKVYTVDKEFGTAEAIAIKDHRIIAVGSSREIAKGYVADEVRNLEGAFVYPGWIDAHCHFFGYGMNLNAVDVAGTESVDEIIEVLKAFREKNPGAWITGRGWDQNDWEVKEFPDKTMLDKHFPKTPILLRRIDGHAAWANSLALEMAGVTADSKVGGGRVMLSKGEPNGILVDNAIGLVARKVPPATEADMINALQQAEKNCFSVGLTSVQDAGISKQVVELIDSLHRAGSLKIRMNTWLSPSEANFTHFVEKGPYQSAHLSINTVKLFTDGALGSRGARMIEPYSDDPGNLGLFVTPLEMLEKLCRRAYQNNFAVATHCIGDAANRETLKIYADILGGENDRRWRIEHAQIIHPDDFHYFGDYDIIPSVQTTHATSDMYWAEDRVGSERMKGAYAFRQLLEQNGWLPNGSDFPVEQINPLFGFYAAVVRKDHAGFPEGGFQPENAISREQALKAMTIWAARSGKEEDLKGSIEVGKLADLVITSTDLMSAPDEALFGIKVQSTYSGGELVYEAGTE